MAQLLEIVAQSAMDLFYTNYASETDFFTLQDFIYHCGAEASDYLRLEWKNQYDQLRADQEDEVIDFSDDWLSYIELDVKNVDGVLQAEMPQSIFSIPYDSQNTGIQDIDIVEPVNSCVQLERTTGAAAWRLKYLPVVNDRIFWYLSRGNILVFYNPGVNSIRKILVEYVPEMGKSSNIPDSIVSYIITNTVSKMNQLMQGKIVKKGLDLNQNKILETEIDKRQIQ